MEKWTKKQIGFYTELYKLNKESVKNVKDRLSTYNDVTLHSLKDLEEGYQVIVVNEKNTGGFILGKVEHAHKCLSILKQENRNKFFVKGKDFTVNNIRKITFSINERNVEGWKL